MTTPFPIVIDVDEQQVGSVLRQLDVMPGVLTIHLRMANKPAALPPQQKLKAVTSKHHPPGTWPALKARREIQGALHKMGVHSVREVIARTLFKGPMHYNLLGVSLEKHGLSPKSVHSAITKMAGDKTIERIAPGTYRLTKRGERKYLQTNGQLPHIIHNNGKMTGGGQGVAHHKGVRGLILRQLALRTAGMPAKEMRDLIVTNDYTANNMYGSVAKMRQEGLIHRGEDGYRITDRGKQLVSPSVLEGEVVEVNDHEPGED